MTADEKEVVDAATAFALGLGTRPATPHALRRWERLQSAVLALRVTSRFAERERLGWIAAAATVPPSLDLAIRSINEHRRLRHAANHPDPHPARRRRHP